MAKTFIGNIGGSILPSGSGYTDVPTQKDAALFDEEGYDVNGVYVERSKGMFIKNSSGGNLFDALSMGVRFHFNNEPEYASWVRRSVIEDREILDELEKFCNSGKYNFVRFYPSISVTGDGNCDVYYNFLVNNQHFGLYVGTIHESKDAFTIEGCVLFIGGVTEAKEPTDELLGLLWTEWAENATQTSHAGKADKATIADIADTVSVFNHLIIYIPYVAAAFAAYKYTASVDTYDFVTPLVITDYSATARKEDLSELDSSLYDIKVERDIGSYPFLDSFDLKLTVPAYDLIPNTGFIRLVIAGRFLCHKARNSFGHYVWTEDAGNALCIQLGEI